jgi:Bacterial Ig domain
MRPRDDDGPVGIDDDPPHQTPDPVRISLQVSSPKTGDVLAGPSNGVTVVVTGTASIDSGDGGIDVVEVALGAAAFLPAIATAPGFGQWTFSGVVTTSGGLAVSVRARHSGGVVQTVQIPITTTITPDPPQADTTPPTIAITSPAARATAISNGAPSVDVPIMGTAGDDAGSVARVEVTVDGVAVPVSADDPGWARWSANATLVGLGPHTIAARAVDAVGLSREATAEVFVAEEPVEPPVVERLLIVEKCRLSTFLGAYGAGRTIKTVSLLPGEKTRLAVKTYKRSSTSATEASSILDSYTSESQDDFENSLTEEQASKHNSDESLKWHAEASASGSWGFASASLSAGASGGTNASREELAKNVSNAVHKHAAKASSKRDLEIKSSREDKEEFGSEFTTESQVENINLNRTLNFNFMQMNQEFITLLHLLDVRVAYVRGDLVTQADGTQVVKYAYREVTLSQLDGLLDKVIVPERRGEVRSAILAILSNVFDYQDEPHRLVEEKALNGVDGSALPNGSYLRVPKGKTSTYTDPATGSEIVVPGVILAAMKNVMRTDGVLCDALLGKGDALDAYSRGLQDEAVVAKALDNDSRRKANAREQLALDLIEAGSTSGADLFHKIYPSDDEDRVVLATAPASNGTGDEPQP